MNFLKSKFTFISILILLHIIISFNICMASTGSSIEKIKQRGSLLWGSDAEGGAPYVFPDPKNPDKLIGFEVDLANAIAKELGVEAKQTQNAWDNLVPSLERGDFDIAMNGIEITPQRQERILFSIPYYIYTEQLTVRADETRIKSIDDVKGMKVGTLSGTVAQDILTGIKGTDVKIYPGQVQPYEDLAIGRIDAVLLDLPIASFYAAPNPKLKNVGATVGKGFYGIAIRKDDADLKKVVDDALKKLLKSGDLKRIYEKWEIWNEVQEELFKPLLDSKGANLQASKETPIYNFFPALLKGAAITIAISVVAMCLAISFGLILSISKLYGNKFVKIIASSYIEIYRGTPLLIQLYILYYGLPNIGITLNPITAAILGLGMNYAAYEAEIYRAGIEAIPRGQMEASLALGMSKILAIKRIILPQAIKIAIPPITNDFIALFKDSSLVSIIAMVELTKTYNILAASTLRFFELGLIVAFLYFGMSYPLSILARKLEKRLKKS
ncbi:ABC transporter permease subunit [Candidatus Poribacteria bacterium]|nr:ABC transporter permease subunit [Candidatus Poribacteria bacterium]